MLELELPPLSDIASWNLLLNPIRPPTKEEILEADKSAEYLRRVFKRIDKKEKYKKFGEASKDKYFLRYTPARC